VLKRFLLLKQIPLSPNFGRLCLRIVLFGSLFIKHGAEKIFTFGAMEQTFVAHHLDPLHIGPIPSLLYAAFADGICTLLLVFGLFTRWAALILFWNLLVVWAFVEHFMFLGHSADHGELIVLYLGGCLALFFSGAGKFSLDALLDRSSTEAK
jgi:putative oxidoreductase